MTISPSRIKEHALVMRRKAKRIYETHGTSHPAVKEIFEMVDDLCELLAALAENQIEWTQQQQAEAPKGDPA